VKGGGALVVGFSTLGALAGKASAATRAANDPVPAPADYLPNQAAVDSWIRLNSDNTVTVTTGQGEYGTGTPTGVLMIAAEELNMSMSQMIYVRPDTWVEAAAAERAPGSRSE